MMGHHQSDVANVCTHIVDTAARPQELAERHLELRFIGSQPAAFLGFEIEQHFITSEIPGGHLDDRQPFLHRRIDRTTDEARQRLEAVQGLLDRQGQDAGEERSEGDEEFFHKSVCPRSIHAYLRSVRAKITKKTKVLNFALLTCTCSCTTSAGRADGPLWMGKCRVLRG